MNSQPLWYIIVKEAPGFERARSVNSIRPRPYYIGWDIDPFGMCHLVFPVAVLYIMLCEIAGGIFKSTFTGETFCDEQKPNNQY